MSNDSAPPPLLEMKGISKSFPGVRALDNVDLTLHEGEVLALLGENGAGKSTLIKILAGAHIPDSGHIYIDGEKVRMESPAAAQQAGVGIIYQEFNLVPGLTARENIFLGQHSMFALTNRSLERAATTELFHRIGIEVSTEALCRDLTVAQQQIVEIAKALSQQARIVVMDEPSAALTPREVEGLAAVIKELKDQGIGVIYISHRLDEVEAFADRITVLRDGKHVGARAIDEVTRDQMIEMMVGRSIENEFPKAPSKAGEVILEAVGLHRLPAVKGVSLTLSKGEILGVAGLVGAGRTETARLLFGADKLDSGEILSLIHI